MSLSTRVLIGLVAGVATGLFLGEITAPLKVVGDAFIQLLQMTVLALHRRLPHRRTGPALLFRGTTAGDDDRLFSPAPVDDRPGHRVPDPAHVSGLGVGLLLQPQPGREPLRLRLPEPVHPVESLQLARQQHGAGGGSFQPRPGRRPDRSRGQEDAAGHARGACRRPGQDHGIRRRTGTVRRLRYRGQRCRNPRSG